MDAYRPRGLIKSAPEHFVVQELVGASATPVPLHRRTTLTGRNHDQPVTVFHLVKRSVSSDYAMQQIAKQLNIPVRNVSNHGMKDRHALTAQCIGVRGGFRPRFEHNLMHLQQIAGSETDLRPSGHRGNRFTIFVLSDAQSLKLERVREFRNVFGQQRFGYGHTQEVGRLMLEGDFERAAGVEHSNKSSVLPQREEGFASWEDAFFSRRFFREAQYRVLQWQSHLWNELVLGLRNPPRRLPMWTPENRGLYDGLWNPQGIHPRSAALLHDFTRRSLLRPENIRATKEPTGWELQFDLPPGAYATVALSQLFELYEERQS